MPQAEGQVELSIVMPCLNEANTVGICIGRAAQFLTRSGLSGEIVVGDNGSTDNSVEVAALCGARVVNVPFRGYGSAIFHATLAARGRYVIVGDCDDSYYFDALEPFVERLRAGYDLVMGNRFTGSILPGAMSWKNRYVGNPVLSGIGRLLFQCPARDLHCGLRGFSREAFQRMSLHTRGMEFAAEMVIEATLAGMRIAEVPVTLHRDGRCRPSHLRPWRDGWRHLRFMLLRALKPTAAHSSAADGSVPPGGRWSGVAKVIARGSLKGDHGHRTPQTHTCPTQPYSPARISRARASATFPKAVERGGVPSGAFRFENGPAPAMQTIPR
jgi:glycosyltransferase involved in cell wall biosynthesis